MTGFPKDGPASRAWPGSTPGRWAKTGNCQVGVSVRLANEHASCAADWRRAGLSPAVGEPADAGDRERGNGPAGDLAAGH
jgi:hypothetical protein